MTIRTGRGRLSSLDLLPPEAEEHVIWAHEQLRRRKLLQSEILDQLNLKLATDGIEIRISKSAFSRASLRLNKMATRIEEVREIAGVMANKFEDGADENLTLLVSETIKMLVYEVLERCDRPKADVFTSEMIVNLANALKAAEQTKKISADSKRMIETNFKKQATEAVDRIAKVKGLTAETRDMIAAEVLGVIRQAA